MKFPLKITYLLLIISMIFSCDKVDELTDIDVTEDFEATVNVDLTEDSEGAAIGFEKSKTIDIASNEEIKENLDLIEAVSINSFTYQFMNYEGPDGGMLSDASISIEGATIAIDDVDIDAASSASTVYTLTDTSFLEALAASLKNNPEVTVTLGATISSAPVSFDVAII